MSGSQEELIRRLEAKVARQSVFSYIAVAISVFVIALLVVLEGKGNADIRRLYEKLSELRLATLSYQLMSIPNRTEADSVIERLNAVHGDNELHESKLKYFPFESIEGRGGVIEYLRSVEQPFNRSIVISQSSNDLWNMVHPYSTGKYGSGQSGQMWIEFRLRTPTTINAMYIKSGSIFFPRSLFICYGPNDELWETSHNLRLTMLEWTRIPLKERRVSQIKLKQSGPNWRGSFYNVFGNVDFVSSDPPYNGSLVFETLFNKTRKGMRHELEIRARDFDPEEIHLPDGRSSICTDGAPHEYVDFEFVRGSVLLSAYRLRRSSDFTLRSWSIRGSNDNEVLTENWTIIDNRHEETKGQWKLHDVYNARGGPYKWIRIVNEGEKWNSDTMLIFKAIEFYGVYISD